MSAAEVHSEESISEAYADEQYKKLLKERDQYVSLDDYCARREDK